jgi:hypothetical protein
MRNASLYISVNLTEIYSFKFFLKNTFHILCGSIYGLYDKYTGRQSIFT